MSQHPILLASLLIPCLVIASAMDLRYHRLPNWLTVTVAVVGLSTRIIMDGWAGVVDGAAGFALAALMFLPFWIARWMGAGDVKLLMALGLMLGWRIGLLVNVFSLLVGIVGSITLLLVAGELPRYLKRYLNMAVYTLIAREKLYIPPNPGDIAARRFPYAVAISLGTVLAVYGPGHLPFVDEWVDLLNVGRTQ
jgi:prepilin peptidase CpaA